jgi:hypothetical protein
VNRKISKHKLCLQMALSGQEEEIGYGILTGKGRSTDKE